MKISIIQNIIDTLRGKNIKNSIKRIENIIIELADIENQISELKYIHLPAVKLHSEIFPQFKNINNGKSVVIVGSGPTLKNYTQIKDAIHIGANYAFTNKNLTLDYLFIQDCLQYEKQKEANKYRVNDCIKFYGYHYIVNGVSQQDVQEANAFRYYFIDQRITASKYAIFSPDITTRPLNTWSSVIFCAMEFALWTHPQKIYLVGCDCSQNGHFYHKCDKINSLPHSDRVLLGWKQIKEFAKIHYPDIEIISINPVGLKGLFKDTYTDEYLKKCQHLEVKAYE